MPLDPRLPLLAGQGVAPIDPIGAMGRGLALAQQYQQTRAGQMQLEEAQRQQQEQRDLGAIYRRHVTTDPATGEATIDLPGAMTEAYRVNPQTAFKMQQQYQKTQAETRQATLEAQKAQLDRAMKGLEFGGQVAQGIEDRIAAGMEPQQAWELGIQTMARAGLPTESITPYYDAQMLAGWKGQAQTMKDRIEAQQKVVDQQLRERELAETTQRTGIERERLTLSREEAAARREDVAERRAERLQGRTEKQEERTFARENTLRDEFTALTKDYRTVADAYGRIQAAEETGPGDISLIFSYMKLLDPASTVREGEFATAQNAGGVPERIIAQYNRLRTGERLAPDTRREFVQQAQALYDRATSDYTRTRTKYADLARGYGVNPANVTQEFGSTATPPAHSQGPGRGETLSEADIATTLEAEQRRGTPKTRQQVIEAARRQGWKVPE